MFDELDFFYLGLQVQMTLRWEENSFLNMISLLSKSFYAVEIVSKFYNRGLVQTDGELEHRKGILLEYHKRWLLPRQPMPQ